MDLLLLPLMVKSCYSLLSQAQGTKQLLTQPLWWYKDRQQNLYSLECSITNEISLNSLRTQFLLLRITNPYFNWTTLNSNMSQIRFLPIQSLKGFLGTDLKRTLFKMNNVVFITSPYKYFGKLNLLTILRIIFLKVHLYLSTTQFYSRDPSIVYQGTISHSCKYMSKRVIFCPEFVYPS